MKRSIYLALAFTFLFSLGSVLPIWAAANVQNATVTLVSDVDGDGYATFGDTVRISCVATYTGAAWDDAPNVNLTSVGLSPNFYLAQQGTSSTYRSDITLNTWRPTSPNYNLVNFNVQAFEGTADNVWTNSMYFDIVQVDGVNATVSPAVINQSSNIVIRIDDNNYQASPNGGTVATINLTPIGGSANTPLTYIGGNRFQFTQTPPDNFTYSGNLTITLKDPFHPAQTFQTNTFIIDTIPSFIDVNGTTVQIMSGNAVALPGDVLRLTAKVTAYGNDNVTVQCGPLTNPPSNPGISTAHPMTLTQSTGLNQPATWQMDLVLTEYDLKNTSLPIIFTFTDGAGNISVLTKYISIDLDSPSFVTMDVNVLFPNGIESPNNVATTSCKLKIVASVPVDIGPDNLSVTADMTSVGGSSALFLTQNIVTGDYEGTYTIMPGILEDEISHTFTVTARDAAGNMVARATTPAIAVDSFAPVITNLLLTTPDANLTVGETFTISLTATGVELGSVSVDLSSIGMSSSEIIPSIGGDNYSRDFILQPASITGVIRDGYTAFRVSVSDTVLAGTMIGHLIWQETPSKMVDNEPAVITNAHINTYHKLYPTDDFGFIRVGDYLSFHAQVASSPINVSLNLSGMGESSNINMIASGTGGGWYDYRLLNDVVAGTINGAPVLCSFSVTDDAGNVSFATLTINLDNQPLALSVASINTSYKPGYSDSDVSIINFNKHLDINVPFTYPLPYDASTTATIDLTAVGLATDVALVRNTDSYTLSVDTAVTDSTQDLLGYRFNVIAVDDSGNRSTTVSSSKTVDCFPASISIASVTIESGAGVAKIGDKLKFRAKVTDNEGAVPTIDLSSLGGLTDQAMTDVGLGYYEYSIIIATGTLDGSTTSSWVISARDNAQNLTAATTNSITVDSIPPQIAANMVVTWTDNPIDNIIKIGDSTTFTITLNDPLNYGTATIDLTAMGGTANAQMHFNSATGSFSINFVGAQTTAEYPNHRFVARVSDHNGNLALVEAPTLGIDCQATTFSSEGITLYQNNGDNPVPTVANVNDVIMAYVTAEAYADAVLSATIASGTIDFATEIMTLNSSTGRHEALFTVMPPGINSWSDLANSKLSFKISSLDDAGNIALPAVGTSTFTVRNATPTITVASFNLNPNAALSAVGAVPVYNIADGSPVDALETMIQLANGDPIFEAWVDFTALGTGTVPMRVTGDSAVTAVGIPATDLPPIDYVQHDVTMVVRGEGGQRISTSTPFIIDNVAPTVVSATFDGKLLEVNVSEEIDNFGVDISQWKIVGSNPLPLDAPTYLVFTATQTHSIDLFSFNATLTLEQQKIMAQWASTPIYLQATNLSAPLVDRAQNWMKAINYSPITITDSAWREEPRVTQVTMDQDWPTKIEINIMFNKEIDPTTLVASCGVLITSNLTYDFTNPDYTTGYIFQPNDSVSWPSPTNLRITMSPDGMDWLAAKLSNNTSIKLKFATRSSAHVFAYDIFGKDMAFIPTSAPITAVDDRPVPSFDFFGPPKAPVLNIASKTLVLYSSDRMRLFGNDFEVADINIPTMGSPTPTLGLAVSTFHNKVRLHDIDKSSNVILQLKSLELPLDNSAASSVVTIKLTDDDLSNIFGLYVGNSAPVWRIQVDSAAFHNWWGTPNNAYMPSGNPGQVVVIPPVGYNAATFAACSMSDKPSFNQHLASTLEFEVEINYPNIDGVELPIRTSVEPTARIIREDTSALLTTGTFVSWTNRIVDGKNRAVVRFSNATSFPEDLQQIASKIEVNGITDAFGNTYNVVATQAYDLNTKNDGYPEGFTDLASAPILIDTKSPVVTSITPAGTINLLPTGSIFSVKFDEDMDNAMIPILQLATNTTTMTFTFSSWTSSSTAAFTNNTPFTPSTLNGSWNYEVSGGYDLASNTNFGSTFVPVQIRTHIPEVQAGRIRLQTTQNVINSSITLENQPWNADVPDTTANFAIQYDTIPNEYLPHTLRLYNQDGLVVGSSIITTSSSSTMANAKFVKDDFATPTAHDGIGPVSYDVKIVDILSNETDALSTVVYDDNAPIVTSYEFANAGYIVGDEIYYKGVDDFTVNLVTSNASDALRMAVYSSVTNATTTYDFTYISPLSYNLNLGGTFVDGAYKLTIVDLAGNVAVGVNTKTLYVDGTKPTVVSITPSDAVGNAPSGLQTFEVVFSEPMDISATLTPELVLATGTTTIDTTFAGWVNPSIPTTARFTNSVDITSPTYPTGTYTYRITGGSDLARNTLIEPTDMEFAVQVFSEGPIAVITNLTLQDHLYDEAKVGFDFNPAFGNGSTTLKIKYSGDIFNTPHTLVVFDKDDTEVGYYSGLTGDADIQFTGSNGGNWTSIPTTPLVDGTYHFKIKDSGGHMISEYYDSPLVIDTAAPIISSFTISDGRGIATDTGSGLIYHYSSTQGLASFSFTSNNTDNLILVVQNATETYTVPLVRNGDVHTADYGSSLVHGREYWVTAADRAGNLGTGMVPMGLIIDNTPPNVLSAVPTLIGGIPAGTGIFDVRFTEAMNTTTASIPVLIIATDTTTLPMTFQQWIASDVCRFTNTSPIDTSFPPGTYSYQVSGAYDLAGNVNVEPVMGNFKVELFSSPPVYNAELRSQQYQVSTETVLLNKPFSPLAAPGVATLSISYVEGPFMVPHWAYVYDNSNEQVATITLSADISAKTASATVNGAFFGSPAVASFGPEVYTFKLVDSIGNISGTSATTVTYDGLAPKVQTTAITSVSDASSSPLYYNPALHGDLVVDMQTDASDQLLLAIASTTATYTYDMNSGTAGARNVTVPTTTTATISDGVYTISALDLAGNAGYGSAANTTIVFDTIAPLATATVTGISPLTTTAAGMATITVDFSEAMNQVTATPTLVLATTTQNIAFSFSSWTNATKAVFVNAQAITNSMPQGDYDCKVTCKDITGNEATRIAATIPVKSRGPIVSSIVTHSFQQTTATDSSEILTDMPFSFDVGSGSSTMSVQFDPSSETPKKIHFIGDASDISYDLIQYDAANKTATFTWSETIGETSGPVPSEPKTYTIKFTDAAGDFSLESYSWTMDASAPVIMTSSITGGEIATAGVYFNPNRHGLINAKFQAIETESPLLRVVSENSTDTYQMNSVGTNLWSTDYTGRYSRGAKGIVEDGQYTMSMVDRAGNIGLNSSGTIETKTIVIDTVSPGISTYSLLIGPDTVSLYAPAAGSLEILLTSGETKSETGVYYINVYNSSNILIKKVPIDNYASPYSALWDGKDQSGATVIDGKYKFVAADYTGNLATGSIFIDVVTSAFKVTGAVQNSSNTVKLWFNQNLDAASVVGANVSVEGVTGDLTASEFTLAEPQAMLMTINPAMVHGTSYTFTVAKDTVKSVYGAGIASPTNYGIAIADVEGPIVTDVTFGGLSGQKEFNVIFGEAFIPSTASDISHYSLTGPSGAISIVSATTQSDKKSVLLTAASDLVENQNYTITVNSVEDALGNVTPTSGNSHPFVGRDLTPPDLQVGVFSNPTNEYDIIIVVTSNEDLQAPPTLQIAQSNAPVINTTMNAGAASHSYMLGVHLSASYPGNGSIVTFGTDTSGNTGTGNATFAVAYMASKRASYMFSADKHMMLSFTETSLKSDAMVKIFNHKLNSDDEGKGVVRTSMRDVLANVLGSLRASTSEMSAVGQSELIPTTEAYEVGIDTQKISSAFKVSMAANATNTTGLGLFRQNGEAWEFISASKTDKNNYYASVNIPGIYAILHDVKSPLVTFSTDMDFSEPFITDRPEFKGVITDDGSGVGSVTASIDGGLAQPVTVDVTDGSYTFKSIAKLTGGDHTFEIVAYDKTNNKSANNLVSFKVVVPLDITQVIQYPNPARRRMFVRISANRSDIAEELVRVRIYDVAGHKVRTLDGIRPVNEKWGLNARFLYDVPWDLKTESGKTVANGVYFAKVEIRDPDNTSKKIKHIQKLVVLR